MFADLDARNIRWDRPELTSNLGRCIHLQIVHVLMPGSTAHVDHDHRLVGLPDPCQLLGLQQLRQRKTTKCQSAKTKCVSTSKSIAKRAATLTED
jgi:hypothetical protein